MKIVKNFLIKNDFIEEDINKFANKNCTIIINTSEECYEVTFNLDNYGKGTIYSNDLSLYWLIGILTYYDLINKNYDKQERNFRRI